MAGPTQREIVKALVSTYGRTYAAEAGITLRDTPQPLYQLLVLADLLSTRIRADIAVAAAKELFAAGMRDPRRMADATWQQRVDALGRGGYRRYDESTATRLGDGAALVRDKYGGDLRELRRRADGDLAELRRGLREFPGVGPTGADIYLREVQRVWPQVAPYLDAKTLQGAELLGLPADPGALIRVAGDTEPAVLAAALVRVALHKEAAGQILEQAKG